MQMWPMLGLGILAPTPGLVAMAVQVVQLEQQYLPAPLSAMWPIY